MGRDRQREREKRDREFLPQNKRKALPSSFQNNGKDLCFEEVAVG